MKNMFDMSKMQNPFAFLQSMGAAANPFTMMQNFNPMAFMNTMNPNTDMGTEKPADVDPATAPNGAQMPNMFPFPPMGAPMPMPGMSPFSFMQNMQNVPGAEAFPPPFNPMQMMQFFMNMMMMQSMCVNRFMQNMNQFSKQTSCCKEEAKPKNTVSFGGMQISPEILHKFLSMDVSPESLNVLQSFLDFLFEKYSKPKEENKPEE